MCQAACKEEVARLTAENEQLKHSAMSLQAEFRRLADIYKHEIVQSIEQKHKHEVCSSPRFLSGSEIGRATSANLGYPRL